MFVNINKCIEPQWAFYKQKHSFLFGVMSKTPMDSLYANLKVHKIENFFDSDFGICVISLIVMSKY
jgi:hypothetical protein